MITSPLPTAVEAWFLSGEFFSPGTAKNPFVQPGRGGSRARRPIPVDDQWSRATAFSVLRSLSLFISPILVLIPLYLSLFLYLSSWTRFSISSSLSCTLARTSLVTPIFFTCQDAVSWSLYQRRLGKGRESLSLSLSSPPSSSSSFSSSSSSSSSSSIVLCAEVTPLSDTWSCFIIFPRNH